MPHEHLNKALAMVRKQAGARSAVGRFAASLLPVLEAAEEEAKSEVVRPSRRGTGEINYLVERTQQGEVLTERKSKSKPYRCPWRIYEILAAVLASADRPLLLDEIVERMQGKLGDRPADHQVRVALRYWLHVEQPLLTRSRSRYRVAIGKSFETEAVRRWKDLNTRTHLPSP